MKVKVSKDFYRLVAENLTSEDLFNRYFGEFVTGGLYECPLRNDKNPSFSFFKHPSGDILAKDFSTGIVYNGVSYVKELFGLTYQETLKKIVADFCLDDCDFKPKEIVRIKTPNVKTKVDIKIQPKKFTQGDIDYWESFGITYNTLKKFNVYSVGKLWIRKSAVNIFPKELCFAYFFPKSNNLKIYRPLSPKINKWRGNVDNNYDIQGYWQVNPKESKPDFLILTSSLKEVMLLWEYGLFAMAIHGEGSEYPEEFIKHLKRHCKRIVSLKDWDEAGRKASQKLLSKYDIPPLPEVDYLPKKDLTDNYKFNKVLTTKYIKEIIKLKNEQ